MTGRGKLAGCHTSVSLTTEGERATSSRKRLRHEQYLAPGPVIRKKKTGQKQPTISGLKRAINTGWTFCGAQVKSTPTTASVKGEDKFAGPPSHGCLPVDTRSPFLRALQSHR